MDSEPGGMEVDEKTQINKVFYCPYLSESIYADLENVLLKNIRKKT